MSNSNHITTAQYNYLDKLTDRVGWERSKEIMMERYSKTGLNELTKEQASDFIEELLDILGQ